MATAFGKVILLGEHAVVYGVPAIAAGLNRGARASASPCRENRLSLGQRELSAGSESSEARAYEALLLRLDVSGVRVTAELDIPSGMGLGASASLGVAIARSVLTDLERTTETPELVLAATDAWERVFHGNPSGIDAAAAYYGGCLSFTREVGVKPLGVGRTLELAVALAGPAASTKKMVEQVAMIRQSNRALFEKTLAGIALLVENAIDCIASGDLTTLGALLDRNQVFLADLLLSTPAIEQACESARRAGAFGAKLTGSGGGGAVIALTTSENRAKVLASWKSQGLECFPSDVIARSNPETSPR